MWNRLTPVLGIVLTAHLFRQAARASMRADVKDFAKRAATGAAVWWVAG